MNPQSKVDNLNSLTVCVYIVSVGTKRGTPYQHEHEPLQL